MACDLLGTSAIIWTNANILSSEPLGRNLNENTTIFIKKNLIEKVACKSLAISSRSQSDDWEVVAHHLFKMAHKFFLWPTIYNNFPVKHTEGGPIQIPTGPIGESTAHLIQEYTYTIEYTVKSLILRAPNSRT